MAEVVLFHHVQGLTAGVRAFAEELGAGGHTVHTPDLFDGKLPETIDEGIALVRTVGDEVLRARTSSRWRPRSLDRHRDGDARAAAAVKGTGQADDRSPA